MAYQPIKIDRTHLTIMGVVFPNQEMLDRTAEVLGSNMFEGFTPTAKWLELYRDYRLGKIQNSNLVNLLRETI
ncbi:hypothetical protein AGMMS49959_12990 [Planctomycetales bacterium]|nr:hypothetical protein AGMMS49959_12990 [Planctomycetales bacterium]